MRIATRASGPDLEGLAEYVRSLLGASLPAELLYHDVWHTFADVVPSAQRLAKAEALAPEHHERVVAAALLHDTGFVRSAADHELHSAAIGREVLPRFGFSPDAVACIERLILATRLGHAPQDLAEGVIMDADLDVLGRPDFWARNLRLRHELAALGSSYDDATWWRGQRQFLRRHVYRTASARRLRGAGKRDNLRRIDDHLVLLSQREVGREGS